MRRVENLQADENGAICNLLVERGKESKFYTISWRKTQSIALSSVMSLHVRSLRDLTVTRDPLASGPPHLTPNPAPSLLNYTQQPIAFEKLMRSSCLCSVFAQVLNTVSSYIVTVEPLLWRHFYSRDTSIQETQIFAQKNVEIIFVYVTSNPGI